MKRTLLAASVAILTTGAHAADIVYEAPPSSASAPIATIYDWTGFYLGLQGGYSGARLDAPFGWDDEFDGGFIGGHAGYNFQQGNIVFGVEGDINYNFNDERRVWLGGAADVGMDWEGSVRGRLGYAWDRTMLYGTAGIAFANGFAEVVGGPDLEETYVGWTVGAGVEHAFLDNIHGRIEYRYTDFGGKDFGLGAGDFDLKQHKALVGVSYKF